MRRVLVIGEAPADLAATAIGPRTGSGARLDRLLRGHGFDALHLLARSLGPADDWPARVARERARELYGTVLAGREVVLLGRRVARAFGAGLSPHLDALHAAPYFSSVYPTVPDGRAWRRCAVWVAPHPSGRSRWWNDAGNRSRAAAFFARLLGRLEVDLGEVPLPSAIPPENWEPLADTAAWPRMDCSLGRVPASGPNTGTRAPCPRPDPDEDEIGDWRPWETDCES